MEDLENQAEIRSRLEEAGLGRVADEIASLAQPAIALFTEVSSDEALPVGISKFGGHPDVPSDFVWPTWNDRPLAFLAQLKLSELAESQVASPLPPNGLLSFFYECEEGGWGFDPNDRESWRVYYFEEGQPLTRVTQDPLPEEYQFQPCDLGLAELMTLPGDQSLAIQALGLSEGENDLYFDAFLGGRNEDDHQILGHPIEIQDAMQLECQLASHGINTGNPEGYEDPRVAELAAGASQWRLLFQIATDENPGWMWGDMGMLFFWITESDLAARRFDKVWMVLQCS